MLKHVALQSQYAKRSHGKDPTLFLGKGESNNISSRMIAVQCYSTKWYARGNNNFRFDALNVISNLEYST